MLKAPVAETEWSLNNAFALTQAVNDERCIGVNCTRGTTHVDSSTNEAASVDFTSRIQLNCSHIEAAC